ncbi:MAG: SUMF1/EgtB/PvdO family nonheme iron enzyme [Cyclobacteriaceae bacterium]|nr:SUMF1/EgtB/PvdO family nonheme iron enzyme [Cyclobacteriaceae bacterium]
MKKLFTYLSFIALLFIAVGCEKELEIDIDENPGGYDDGTTTIPASTKYISPGLWNTNFIGITEDSSTIVFKHDLLTDQPIKKGDVLISSEGDGFLRKVVEVNVENSQIEILTEPASLIEAFENLEINLEIPNDSLLVESIELFGEGVSSSSRTSGLELLQKIEFELKLGADDIKLKGFMQQSLNIGLNLKIRNWELEEFKFSVNVENEAEAKMVVDFLGLKIEEEKEIARVRFKRFVITVGGVPLVFRPVLIFNVGSKLEGGLTGSFGLNAKMTAENGIHYLNPDWTPLSTSTREFNYFKPKINGKASAESYLDLILNLRLYDLAGPHATVRAYAEATASLNNTPHIQSNIGFRVFGGANMELFGLKYKYQVDLLEYKYSVDSDNNAPPTVPSNPIPADKSEVTVPALELKWSPSTDPEDDPISYNVFFGTDNPPVTQIASGISNVQVEIKDLEMDRIYYWSVDAIDGFGNTTPGPAWSFTTSTAVTLPQVITNAAQNVTQSSAVLGGNVTSDGGAMITERGVFYGLQSNPESSGTKVAMGAGMGVFSATVDGLAEGTTYYVKAYAANNTGIAYGGLQQFSTTAAGGGEGGGSDTSEMIFVEGSTFQMGCDDTRDGNCQSYERPVHSVTVSSFHLSKYEITHKQYIDFLNAINCNSNGTYNDPQFGNVTYIDMSLGAIGYSGGRFNFKGHQYALTDDTPVILVTWFGANAYCRWAGGRLPTKAEWEYAARGGNKSQGYRYSGSNDLNAVAWWQGNIGDGIHPVGTKQANELGLHDMTGNVWEWCDNWFYYYSEDPSTNPKGPATGTWHVLRGGAWYFNTGDSRVAGRFIYYPADPDISVGFRLLRE